MTERDFDMRQAVRKQWDELAGAYQKFRAGGDAFNELIEVPAMRALIGDVKGKRVLDAGCGGGEMACYCAAAGAEVTAVDISTEMILAAGRRASKQRVTVNFVHGDMEDLPELQAESFDLVIASLAIAGRLSEIVAEAARLLKVGGALCIADIHPFLDAGTPEVRDGRPGVFVSDYYDRSVRSTVNPFGTAEGSGDVEFFWRHYTISDFFDALASNGFVVERFCEPKPTVEGDAEKISRANSYPIFFLIRARKA